MDPVDPPRWADAGSGAPPAARRLVEAARADGGTPAEVAALEARLAPLLWAPGAPPAPLAKAGSGLAGGAAAKVGVGAAIAALSAGTWLALRSPEPPRPATELPAVERLQAPPPAVPAPEAVQPAVESPAPADTAGASPDVDVARSAPAPRASAAAPAETEAALLGRAQSALRSNPAEALALTARHARLFSHGALGQEREVLAIEALARLGRRAEAAARADRFLKAHPGSTYRSKIAGIVGSR